MLYPDGQQPSDSIQVTSIHMTQVETTNMMSMGTCASDLMAAVTLRSMRLLREDSAQDLVEYALILALVMLGAVSAIGSLGTKIAALFSYIGTVLNSST